MRCRRGLFLASVLAAAVGACAPAGDHALVYSVTGYEAAAAKRALVRADAGRGMSPADAARARWQLSDANGTVVASGGLKPLPDTWGLRLWEADFGAVAAAGIFRLAVSRPWTDERLESAPFEIGTGVLGRKLFKALSIENAAARVATAAHGGGFYDCNSYMGEARSHGAFVAGLVDAFLRWRDRLSPAEQARYREQIFVGVRYLLAIRNADGSFADHHPARPMGRRDESSTPFALFGLAKALAVLDARRPAERELGRRIVAAIRTGRERVDGSEAAPYSGHLQASLAMLLFRYTGDTAEAERATAHLGRHLAAFRPDRRGGYAAEAVAPYFEALHEWLAAFPDRPERAAFVAAARRIAREGYLPVRADNGFRLFAVGEPRSYRDALASPGRIPKGAGEAGFWSNAKVARIAIDAVLLAEIADEPGVADIATAAIGWITGLNGGVRARDTSLKPGGGGNAVVAAAYVANIAENHAAVWRRWWWPGDRARVVSVVNGATVTPETGWTYSPERFESSETFILSDGLLLSAMAAYERYYARPPK